jgi:uncharacterized protein YndB with AHSA1/START domain
MNPEPSAVESELHEFTITRVFDAPQQVVFDAWIDPEQLTRWFGPRGVHSPLERIDVDPRPGGVWDITMIDDETDAEYPASFEIREISEPDRLVIWAGSRDPDDQGLVTVTFEDVGGKTEMTLHATGVSTSDLDMGIEAGWGSSFDKLADALDRP